MSLIHYTSDALALNRATFGQGNGSVIEHVHCSGSEFRVIDCPLSDHDDYLIYYFCDHREDAGVRCCK